MLKPAQPIAPLTVPLAGGGRFDIAASRPSFAEIEAALRFVLDNKYPPRGTV